MEHAKEFRGKACSRSGTRVGTIRYRRLQAEHELGVPFTHAITGPTVMGLFSKDIKNMDDLSVHTLRDIC